MDDTTSAAAAYVAMTRGRERNTAHLVAPDTARAREQWVQVFHRDRADLGPAHAAQNASHDIHSYGTAPAPIPVPRPIPSLPHLNNAPRAGGIDR